MPDERSRAGAAQLQDIGLLNTNVLTPNGVVANNAEMTLQFPYSNAIVFIGAATDEALAIFLLSASGTSTELSDPMGLFTAVKGTAASFNVYYQAGGWILENKRGGSRTVFAIVFRMALPT